MAETLSVLMITKNAQETMELSLKSVAGWVDEIILVDDYSTDKTVEIAKKYNAKVFLHHEEDFGKQKAYGLSKTKGEWILVLDSDEVISDKLKEEIIYSIKHLTLNTKHSALDTKNSVNGYYIYYQNHFLGKALKYGGEDYKKLVFFKKEAVTISPALVHEEFRIINGKAGTLKNKIYHYSYRSLTQMYRKFTDYSFRSAKQKVINGEKTSLKKIFLYPAHMFWARFIKDKGYKDGLFRLPLDLGFAYMEFLTYFLMLFIKSNYLNH